MKYKELKARLGENKRLTRIITVTEPCRLRFLDLLIYSTLIWRNKESGSTIQRLGLLTGTCRKRTVQKVLRRLHDCNLVVQKKGKWFAVDPAGRYREWFSLRPGEEMVKRFNYNWIGVPAEKSPLSNLQAAVVTTLLRGKSHSKIAKWLRVSLRTVTRAANIIHQNEGSLLRSWFQDIGKVEKKKRSVKAASAKPEKNNLDNLAGALGITYPYSVQQLTRNCKLMTAGGITPDQVQSFWTQLLSAVKDPNGDSVYDFLMAFVGRFQTISADHNYNRSKGKENARNETCYKLLCSEFNVKPLR